LPEFIDVVKLRRLTFNEDQRLWLLNLQTRLTESGNRSVTDGRTDIYQQRSHSSRYALHRKVKSDNDRSLEGNDILNCTTPMNLTDQ